GFSTCRDERSEAVGAIPGKTRAPGPGTRIESPKRSPASGPQLAYGAEERPGPAGLPLEHLGESDQVAGVAGVEFDHAAGHESVVRSDETALRGLAVVRVGRQVDPEERAIGRVARTILGRGPAPQQHAH